MIEPTKIGLFDLYHGDCVQIIPTLGRVDHIITDPPYCISNPDNRVWGLKGRKGLDFGEWDYGFSIESWLLPAIEKLKDGGSLVCFCSIQQISNLIEIAQQNGLVFKDVIRWIKTNPMPRNINRRYVVDWELAVWFTKGKGWTFHRQGKYSRPEFRLSIPQGKHRFHPTQKPVELIEEIIKIHTNPDDVVLDPFMGSGTTGIACQNLNRKFIGIEKDDDYFAKAKTRLEN